MEPSLEEHQPSRAVTPKPPEEHQNDGTDGATTSNAVDEEENKFQQAIAAWRNVDLTALVPKLDQTATDIVEHQKEALEQRKDLAQKTRDFRKLDDAGKLSEYKALLKAYQSFIDVVTNQSKAVQAAFLQVYSPLSEAPDPYPLLEASIEGLITADETLPKLQGENDHLQKQVASLTSQLEDSEKRLEDERSTRQTAQSVGDVKVREVEKRWEAVLQEKQGNWEAKEKSLEEKVENQDRLLKELKANYEVSQRLGKSDEDNAGSTATAAELEIVSSELDRTHARLAEVEARNERLRLELAQSASKSGDSGPIEEAPAFLRLQSENTSLARRLETVRYDKDAELRKLDDRLRSLERDTLHLKTDRDSLRVKVQRWGDYDSIKSELEVLKTIEFATGDDDENEAELRAATEANGSADPTKRESLEQLLLARNKKLSNDLTLLRVAHNELQRKLEALQDDHSTANQELEKHKSLAVTLENDLLKVQQEAANAFDAKSVAGTYTSRYPASSYRTMRGAKNTSPTSSIISGFDPGRSSSPSTLESLRAGEPGGGGSGILPMVTAQRDRFKKKNSELESELQKQYQAVSSLRSEIASLQKDNLSLYEKTRYINTFTSTGPSHRSTYAPASSPGYASSSSAYPNNPYAGSGSGADKYQTQYESHISPFSRFRSSESARAMKRMSLPERAVWQVTRMVLATRTSRNLFAGYCLALHLLILMMLYYMGSLASTPSLAEAAAGVGGAAAIGALPPAADGAGGGGGAVADGGWMPAEPPTGGG